jgi:pimeloyl-ACP methyl ester carboxylesterase
MRLLFALLILIGPGKYTFGQEVINNEVTLFSLDDPNGKIDFIVADTTFKEMKPIFLWFQGSQPIPLYVQDKDKLYLLGGGISNFEIESIKKKYYLVVVSMPTVPPIVNLDRLSNQYLYLPDPKESEPSIEFQRADFLENYVKRVEAVVEFLKKKEYIDASVTFVAGHSQGVRIATEFCAHNEVSAVGLFSPNPLSRITEMIRKPFFEAKRGNKSWKLAEEEMNYYTELGKWVRDSTLVNDNPSLISWRSFSKDPITTWLELDMPIYFAYGTEDASADLCELIPYYFDKCNKRTPTMMRDERREHNFFLMNEGKPDYKEPGWETVMNDFIAWLDEIGDEVQ